MHRIFDIFKSWPKVTIHSEIYTLILSVYISTLLNQKLWAQLSDIQTDQSLTNQAIFGLALFVLLTTLNYWILSLISWGRSQKIVLGLVTLAVASAAHFSNTYDVHYDTSMMANLLATDYAESRELLSWRWLWSVWIYSVPVVLLGLSTRISKLTVTRKVTHKLIGVSATLVLSLMCLLPQLKTFTSVMRNHHDLRHYAIPVSMVVSGIRQATVLKAVPAEKLVKIGEDAQYQAPVDKKNELMVIVVGETVRAANWGLSAYSRDTTPLLRKKYVINFPYAVSCGTNTETSVPCMFSVYGRENYSERKIKETQNLLHIVHKVGFGVTWIDNQSGCKGVCAGLEFVDAKKFSDPKDCFEGHCYDSNLLSALEWSIDHQAGNQVIVLHQIGNHGPAYYKRYPENHAFYQPECRDTNLDRCSKESLINAYDNSIRYTDKLLSGVIDLLEKQKNKNVSMIYVSDHGESLGEKGVYLHGMPYAIAPKEQKEVPMMFWFSEQYQKTYAKSVACLKQQSKDPAHHDHIFHTVLGLLNIQTASKKQEMDLSQVCHG